MVDYDLFSDGIVSEKNPYLSSASGTRQSDPYNLSQRTERRTATESGTSPINLCVFWAGICAEKDRFEGVSGSPGVVDGGSDGALGRGGYSSGLYSTAFRSSSRPPFPSKPDYEPIHNDLDSGPSQRHRRELHRGTFPSTPTYRLEPDSTEDRVLSLFDPFPKCPPGPFTARTPATRTPGTGLKDSCGHSIGPNLGPRGQRRHNGVSSGKLFEL